MATITGNVVHADPDQWFTLDYTFANSKFTWSVTAHASHTSYWNTIYGLTVNVGGNSYYKGDISWQGYTPNTVVYSGTTNLSDCTISNGQVTLSVSGNFYYGTWNSDYTSSGSGQCAVKPPTVASLTYTATNKYGSTIVANRSVITFTLKGTSQTGSNSITYALYQGSTLVGTASGTSGTAKTINVTAPAQGTYLYKYTATDGNGTTNTSGTVSVSTQTYTPPSFNSVSAVRWTTGNSSGTASDEGTYCKATASWNVGKVGTTNLTTTLKVTVNSTSSTTTTNGASLYMGGGALSPDNSYTVTFKLYDSYTGESNGVVRTDTLTMGGRGLDFIYANGHYGIGIGQKAVADQFNVNVTTTNIKGNTNIRNGDGYTRLLVGTTDTSGDHIVEVDGQAGRMQLWAGSSYKGLWVDAHGTGAEKTPIVITTNNYTTMELEQINLRSSHTSSNSTLVIQNASSTVTNAITRTSGWTIAGQRVFKWGRVITVSMWFSMPSSGTGYTGNRAFNGTIASGYRPNAGVVGQGWFNANSAGSHSFAGLINNDGSITISYQDDCTFAGGYAYISWTYVI